ncbi:hypothetical protein [Dictyobacter arantiisoli]|uniref:hypothetical protein n=1 Tax=Dictyobacter arantiisoli TaxID=2014874 RepID=UPI00155A793D|nr:hypothetical protein [Dictyobacter arantiisoli]
MAAPEPANSFKPSTLSALSALAVPHKRRWVLVPTRHRLFSPGDDLLLGLRILTGKGSMDDDTLHRLSHVQPGPAQWGVQGHDPIGANVSKKVLEQPKKETRQVFLRYSHRITKT